MIDVIVTGLAAIGLLVSVYFTGVAYRWFPPDVRWVPNVCRLDEATCASVVFTPQARLVGVPNSLLGIAWYAALLVGVATGVVWRPPYHALYLAAASLTVAFAGYLTHALVRVLRVGCRLCFASHAINATLLALLLAGG